ncbi:MAG: LysR family transcriptional regulator [Opitutaceae bacterium]|jgi:DNA-binding transcriptional LysR family regulator
MFEDFLQKKGLSIERLHTLVLLSEARSLRQAAGDDLGQQARMSHQLRELGEFFGVKLTERSGRTLRLSSAGQDLAAMARTQLGALERFAETQRQEEKCWAVGAGDSVLQWWLMPALAQGNLPARWSFQNYRTSEIVARVGDERLDFGVVRGDAARDNLGGIVVGTIKYVIVVPERLRPRRLTIKQALTELPHAALSADGQFTERVKRVATRLGGVFQPKVTCDSLVLCLAAVRTGRYAAVVPRHAVQDIGSVEVIESKYMDDLSRTMMLIWNPRGLETLGENAVSARDTLKQSLIDASAQWDVEEDEPTI